jgi:HNH endonuclease/AAA domain
MREKYGRIEGRRGVKLRQSRLLIEPLCRHCLAKGITRASEVPDHIVPLSQGGQDVQENIQCLCLECHAEKTAAEGHFSEAAANHPEWLKPSAVPLFIVTGPPASGKTTYIQQRRKPEDILICVDTILQSLIPGHTHWHGNPPKQVFNKAIRIRNRLLASLADRRMGEAWFIVSAPTQQERQWWQGKLGGEIVHLQPSADECKRRAIQRGTPNAIEGIRQWFQSSKLPWKAKPSGYGEDGWPLI